MKIGLPLLFHLYIPLVASFHYIHSFHNKIERSKFGMRTLKPHLHSTRAGDNITLALHKLIPQHFQQAMRTSGLTGKIIDYSAYVLAAILAVTDPSMVLSQIKMTNKLKVIYYGNEIENYYEYLELKDEGPIFVFVHGGAWGSGKTWMFRKIATEIANMVSASAVAILSYPYYPKADISVQSQSIINAINCIRSQQLERKSPLNRIILCGHSSGANICALSILQSCNSQCRLVDRFIGLSGVYDISKHYEWEASRGLHIISPMGGAAIAIEKFPLFSPTVILNKLLADTSDLISYSHYFPPTLLVHGTEDNTVPFTSSVEFHNALQHNNITVELYTPKCEHMDPITVMLFGSEPLFSDIKSYINFFLNKYSYFEPIEYSNTTTTITTTSTGHINSSLSSSSSSSSFENKPTISDNNIVSTNEYKTEPLNSSDSCNNNYDSRNNNRSIRSRL